MDQETESELPKHQQREAHPVSNNEQVRYEGWKEQGQVEAEAHNFVFGFDITARSVVKHLAFQGQSYKVLTRKKDISQKIESSSLENEKQILTTHICLLSIDHLRSNVA